MDMQRIWLQSFQLEEHEDGRVKNEGNWGQKESTRSKMAL